MNTCRPAYGFFRIDAPQFGWRRMTTSAWCTILCGDSLRGSLNRKSEKSCLNVICGTLEFCSWPATPTTITDCGASSCEHVAVPGQPRMKWTKIWRSTGNGRLRSLCAHQEILGAHDPSSLLPRARTIFRPSIVSAQPLRRDHAVRYGEVVRVSAGLPVLPFRPNDKIDI